MIHFSLFVGPPVLECGTPLPFIVARTVNMDIGCDLLIENGVVIILIIVCDPKTRRPTDCVMTTPNGTNVLDINDRHFSVQKSGNTVVTVLIRIFKYRDRSPHGFDVPGVWTCECNNSDGHAVAHSVLGCACEFFITCSATHVNTIASYIV